MGMKFKAAFIMVHGQGTDKEFSHVELFDNLREEISNSGDVLFHPIKYYSKIQSRQYDLMDRMPKFGWLKKIREKLVNAFGDSATIKGNGESYREVMAIFRKNLIDVRGKIEPSAPIFILGHSLGSVLLSNFIWDMQQVGILDAQIKGIFTTGNPSYIFNSGLERIVPIQKTHKDFFWLNFWNKKDVISSPLGPFSKEYQDLVTDIRVRKGFFFNGHGKYDGDKKVYKKIARMIKLYL